MSETNWKSKYQELKAKLKSSVEASFKIGFEQGAQQAQMQAQADQAAQAQAAAQQGQPGQEGGAPGEEGGEQPGQEQQPGQENPQGSELDQHINTLQSMVQKSELKPEDLQELKKSLDGLVAAKQAKEAQAAIKGIAKALNRPNKIFNLSPSAQANLSSQAKSAVTMQERVINDVMKSWKEEEERVGKDVLEVLESQGIIKKD